MELYKVVGARPRQATPVDDEVRKVRAALEQIDASGGLRNFPGPSHERLALVTFARTRGLIVWKRSAGQHELTPAGRKWLRAHGGTARVRHTFPTRLIAATVGAAVIAGAWFAADASRQLLSPGSRTVTASPSRSIAKPNAMTVLARTAPVILPTDGPLAQIQADAPVFAAATRPGAMADNVTQPAGVEPAPTSDQVTKKAAKPHRKASRARHPRNEDRGSALAYFDTSRPAQRATGSTAWGAWNSGRNSWNTNTWNSWR